VPGDIDHQRDIAIGARRENEFLLQPREAWNNIGPGVDAMPGQIEIIRASVAELLKTELRPDPIEHAPVQDIELDERLSARAYLCESRRVQRAPSIGKCMPVEV